MSESVFQKEEEDTPRLLSQWLHGKEFLVIGESISRVDSLEMVTGRAKFMEDHFAKDMLFARLVKSGVSSAALKGVDFRAAASVPGFVDGVTARDVRGRNEVGYYISDQPAFAERVIRFDGEPVGLVVASSPEAAEESSKKARVISARKAAVYDPLKAISSRALVHEERKSNVALTTRVRKGDVEKGFAESDVVIENTYRTGYQDHAYIEPEGALATPTSEGMTVLSCSQYPHLAQKMVARVLGYQQRQVRIIQTAIGGGFGGKDDMGPIVAAQAAIAAQKLARPIMLNYSREDSLTSHCKRERAVIRYKTGATKDGLLRAVEADITFDAGAYANRGPFTLWRATMHASGPYVVPNAKVDGMLVYTNKVYQGSFRGFGNPPVQFAAESNLDEVAISLGLDPVDIRLKNLLRKGTSTITDQPLNSSVGIHEALRRVARASSWRDLRRTSGGIRDGRATGVGVACAWHGISTSRGVPDWSSGYLVIRKDGSVDAYTGIVEIGQGTTTAITQMVAEALGARVGVVAVHMGTSDAPDTGATHASRGSSVGSTGMLVAAARLRRRLDGVAAKMLGSAVSDVSIEEGFAFDRRFRERKIEWTDLVNECYSTGVETAATGYYFVPKGKFDEERGSGFAYPAFSFMTVVVEVEVDLRTGMVTVKRIWPGIAAGRIINPALAEAQVHGAAAQGLGYALMEELIVKSGKVINSNLTDYLIPTVRDMPEVEKLVFVEDLFEHGPFGAKGVGEMALIPMAAGIANAVRNATGRRPRELPMTPERTYHLIRGGEAH
ncbi:MAG TPA: xanthine dehydrogenase family protein molybdopterin-binding subunit [Conexivisphaerales archaeon]|nr:xanthine dehydrogenase family protein molybdopterin-binding subunit [Conexivisphaerales archaeon]